MVPQSARERDALMYVTNTRRLEDGVEELYVKITYAIRASAIDERVCSIL